MVTISVLLLSTGKTTRVSIPEGGELVVTRVQGVSEPVLEDLGGGRLLMKLDQASLSSPHARFSVEGGEVWVEDLGSRNGTYLRVERNQKHPVRERTSWLGAEVAVRAENDFWTVPEALDGFTPEALRDLIQERLRGRGMRVDLGEATLGSYTLNGDARHIVVRPENRNRTLDIDDGTWVQLLLNSWNAAQALRESARGWRFSGVSSGRRRAHAEAIRVAPSTLPVLLIGPRGVGKSLLAQDLHEHSVGARGPFVTVACASLPPEEALGRLVGHADGEGLHPPGFLESTQDGTVYLDEVQSLPEEAQLALEQYLVTGTFVRVGESTPRNGIVRVVASCERDPRLPPALMSEGLYGALSVVRIEVPVPTAEDLTRLAEGFLRTGAERVGIAVSAQDVATIAALAGTRVWSRHIDDLRASIEQLLQTRAPNQSWGDAWWSLVRSSLAMAEPADSASLPVQPAVIGRYLADAIFLATAMESTRRSEVPKRLQMTFQGADLRYRALNVDYHDRASLEARLQQLLSDLRTAVDASPAIEALLRRVLNAE